MGDMKIDMYNDWIGGIVRRYRESQIKAAMAVNVEMRKEKGDNTMVDANESRMTECWTEAEMLAV